LINASPDLARQVESKPALQPRPETPRNSPITGVLLTNADLDHALGLLLLRQREQPLVVYAKDETRVALSWIDIALKPFCGIEWRAPATQKPASLEGGLALCSIDLAGSVAFQLRDESSGALILVAPAVGEVNEGLRHALENSDVVLWDGTFWSNDELRTVRPGARSARQMNHLPICDGSLDVLRDAPSRRKIYTHINNTNPILMPGSPERAAVEHAGIEIACDGLEIVL
jgi:pyrroloquinoline quinone biosynthesis protein B